MKEPLAKDQDKFVLRLPDGMRDRIKAVPDKNNRSMNAEIVATLETKYPAPIEYDFEEFERKWLIPLYENTDTTMEDKLLSLANKAAKNIHPALSVWQIAQGKNIVTKFGVREPRKLPPEQIEALSAFLMQSSVKRESDT